MAAIVQKQVLQGTSVSLMTTELNSLATTGTATAGSSTTNNVGSSNTDGYTRGYLHLHLAAPQAGALNSNSGFAFWFLRQENSVAETTPPSIAGGRPYDVYLPAQAISGAQDIIVPCRVPVGVWTGFLIADTTGRTLATSANTLSITLLTDEMV